ncbi:Gfo/Idh/MocA family protein [Plebeiibacterium marinum]|uniref:Gfo/Idh/MocA family oxidoreductase n=1 Tax=Plebeiibacterium marinum TaxID=2992111 RepID=A0AAE3MEJ9_9BACT|nr:Gfo/Idh/MocA family oxidoreductase [Plebeiobacterium marinum]MCW3806160.1 Gfo/Idh/MocA family oxidoreductase [Plebeiobacterium marinum]
MAQKEGRREFLKRSVLASAGAALALSPINNTLALLTNGKKVKLGYIGVGGRGQHLLRLLFDQQISSDYEVVTICDNYQPSIDAALEIFKEYGRPVPKIFLSHQKMVKNIALDGVVVATPLFAHAHISIDCMNAGIHVLCEKAMARTLDDTKAMYDTHIKTGSILLIGHQRIFSKVYTNAINQIHNGKLGEIGQIRAYWHRNNDWRRPVPKNKPYLEKKINWRLYNEYSAGLLTELMSHQLQIANWALKQNPTSVMGTGSIRYWKDGRQVDDNIALIYSYPDGTQFVYDSLNCNKKYGCQEHILGSKGAMELETNKFYSENPPQAPGILQLINDIEKDVFRDAQIGGASWVPETAVKYEGETIITNKQKGDGTAEELVHFIKCIQKKSAPEWILKEGYNTSIWTLLGEQAIESGTKITCPEKYLI